jgi:tRNA U34 5-methylaminomethyl-2-thiouridine-forming methyltransferase MnmC
MHSRIGPVEEARLLYVEQSRLVERLSEPGAPLVVWDVGLGMAANSVAAVDALERATGARELRLVSFENDLGGLQAALGALGVFPFLKVRESMLRELLEKRTISRGRLRWDLLEGDFSERMREAPAADVVFYDFYAPDSCPELWDERAFARLAERLAADGVIYTYASATWVRLAMLLAGLRVGEGSRTAEKTATTVGTRSAPLLERPLTRGWLERKLAHGTKLAPAGSLPTRDLERLGRISLPEQALNA